MKPLILSALLVITAIAKGRNWEMGMVRDAATISHYAGQIGTGTPLNIVTQTVVIVGVDSTYTARREVKWHWSKAALTVNTHVKFTVENDKLFLIDQNHKQYEYDITKQVTNPY